MSDNHAPLTRAADTCEIDGTVFASFWNPRAHTVTDKEVAEAYVWIKDNSTFTENELATAGHYLETLRKALSRADTVMDKEREEALETVRRLSNIDERSPELAKAEKILEKTLSRPKHTPIQAKMLRHALMSAKCSFHTDEEREAINQLLKECK